MLKKYLIYTIAILSFLMAVIPNSVKATEDYVITNYNIDMIVNEDNTFDITETIDVYFYYPKHGIYRKIPTLNTVNRLDGTSSKNRAKISDIKVNEKYTISYADGYKEIRIGDANKTLTGSHTYEIKYKYDIGNDPVNGADELYFNLIGNQWDTSISNLTFSITMPKIFDKEKLGFSSGKYGNTDSNVNYYVEDNTIKGQYLGTLSSYEGLTVRLTLYENYFIKKFRIEDIFPVIMIAICIACVIVAYVIWKKYGKDDEVIETVEFYPPEGYNSAEVGYLYKGSASNEAVISLLVYLANKGYLKIEEVEGKDIRAKGLEKDNEFNVIFFNGKSVANQFKLIKLKEYDGENEYEKMFFEGLFESAKTNENNEEYVTSSSLFNKFYKTLNSIKKKLESKSNKNQLFISSASKKIKWILFMIIAIFVLITVVPILQFDVMLIFAIIFPVIGFGVLIGSILDIIKIPKTFAILWGTMFGGIPLIVLLSLALSGIDNYLPMYLVAILTIIVLVFFAKIMPKRTKLATELLGKIRGFRNFLNIAEKEELEKFVNDDPQYFYNILPYTYALGVSDIWMKKFETLAMQAPDWYVGHSTFDTYRFNTFMHNTMKIAQNTMTSVPNSSSSDGFLGSSSGGGSSGGGFSGGGSGGGGGRFVVNRT